MIVLCVKTSTTCILIFLHTCIYLYLYTADTYLYLQNCPLVIKSSLTNYHMHILVLHCQRVLKYVTNKHNNNRSLCMCIPVILYMSRSFYIMLEYNLYFIDFYRNFTVVCFVISFTCSFIFIHTYIIMHNL